MIPQIEYQPKALHKAYVPIDRVMGSRKSWNSQIIPDYKSFKSLEIRFINFPTPYFCS